MPPPVPPSVNDGRTMTGNPILPANSIPSFVLLTSADLGTSRPMRLHRVFEEEAVFGLLDGGDVRADQSRVVLLEDAAVGKFDREVQRGLSANGGQHGESGAGRHLALDADDLFQIFERERLDVGAVGRLRVGHDGRRVRVGQHHFVALRLERLAGLRAGVVELRRLPDDDGPGAEDEDLRDVSAFRHLKVVNRLSSCTQ